MVALDQRESLRRMFPAVNGQEVGDDTLRGFKQVAMRSLSPHTSAMLLDRLYAVRSARPAELAPGCALILAADVLDQPPGRPVVSTSLDPFVTADYIRQVEAAAVKLLVIWTDGGSSAEREELVRSFLAVAEDAGVASLVEGIVRPAGADSWTDPNRRHDAILRAAAELASYGPSLYKAEVPGYVPGDLSQVRQQSERLTDLVPVPWVVLSNGVRQDDFAAAVEAAVEGGAGGFLAGRAIWSDTVTDPDPAEALHTRSTARLRSLADVVDVARGT